MIIVRLVGGLGNQLFQYAAGLGLSTRTGDTLALDVTAYKHYPDRRYFLDNYRISAVIADWNDVLRLAGLKNSFIDRLVVKFRKGGVSGPKTYFKEPSYGYTNRIESISSDAYLDGYWQSPRYFAHIEEKIRSEFTLRRQVDKREQSYLKAIESVNAVSVHFRRGDYVTNPGIRKRYVDCSDTYYMEAIRHISTHIAQPRFFVFSDEPGWVMDQWGGVFDFVLIEQSRADTPYSDLQLMAACRHHIIANSTFSWWGAWLNGRSDKVVIAPSRWFTDSKVKMNDLLPSGWIKIDPGQ